MIETLLIPTDGSDPARAAAKRGFALAADLEASVHVLSVADSSIATGAGYSGDSPSIRRRLREKAETRATSLCEVATDRGLEATAATREGIPAKEIAAYAEEHADAIVIGTAGRGGLSRAIVGSVADKVVRTAPVPVVTVTEEAAAAEGTVESILCPTDASAYAASAIERAFDLASVLEATVHLLAVVDTDLETTLAALSGDEDSPTDPLEAAERFLSDLASDGRDRGLEVHTAVRAGDPATEIGEYVAAVGIDLVAMGTAGRGGFERALVGSVTDEVVRTATVPVLTVRPDEG